MDFRRRLYTRGSSYETTIPKPLLFSLDLKRKHDVRFRYDEERGRWYIELELAEEAPGIPEEETRTPDASIDGEG